MKDAFEQVNSLNKLTANMVKRISDCSLENMNDILNVGGKSLKNAGPNKGLEDVSSNINELGATYINCLQRASNAALGNFAELTNWLANNAQTLNPVNAFKPERVQPEKEKRS